MVQSGGIDGAFTTMPFVGTAPIVESGSNANGNWIKYADGTMICQRVALVDFSNISVPQVFDCSKPFVGNASMSVSSLSSTMLSTANSRVASFASLAYAFYNGSFNLRVGLATTAPTLVDCILTAIGRWK